MADQAIALLESYKITGHWHFLRDAYNLIEKLSGDIDYECGNV